VDADHNRTVLTFAGPPDAVAESAYAAIAEAARLIDMDEHEGQHPRIGATDVVPFVPISGVSMEDCVELANALGKRVGEELGIPVYLYERAARRPERENLAKIRKGEYEALKISIETEEDRIPDFGPRKLGKAGATVIGARPALIAFNVYLTTPDLDIAKQIARTVRHSSGGLPFVKALGMLVDGIAQVSMNLTNYEETPIAQVVEAIRQEAESHGVGIRNTELVGLIPQAALVDAAQWYLQLDMFEPDQVLETRLYAVMSNQVADDSPFLDALASAEPTPGGGSAAAYAGGMGAALVEMVARLTVGKKKYVVVEDRMLAIAEEAADLRRSLSNAVDEDSAAFDAVIQAYRMPKEGKENVRAREDAIEAATLHASEIPLRVAQMASKVLYLAAEVAETGNLNAASDAGAGGALAAASLHAAAMNVEINANSLEDEKKSGSLLKEIEEIKKSAAKAHQQLADALLNRASIHL
jgi:glutamate formiminotransferase/formiminotetrahydrofolate cyclodeaminase